MKPLSLNELAEEAANRELHGRLAFADHIYENAERHNEPATANAIAQHIQLLTDWAA